MTADPHRYILTIDTVADAAQFTNADSATAIVQWVNGNVHGRSETGAVCDLTRNVISLPPPTRPSHVELGWWVVRWPSGEFGTYSPASLASMFDRPAYLVDPSSASAGLFHTYHDRAVTGLMSTAPPARAEHKHGGS